MNGPGLRLAYVRMICCWFEIKNPKRVSDQVKLLIAYYIIVKIDPASRILLTWITRFFPFSRLFSDRLFHVDNLKARNLMRGMEDVAKAAGIPVYINDGHRDRNFSVFYGKMERGGINKERAVIKMQELFREKFGDVYVQNEKLGFRVLVDSRMV